MLHCPSATLITFEYCNMAVMNGLSTTQAERRTLVNTLTAILTGWRTCTRRREVIDRTVLVYTEVHSTVRRYTIQSGSSESQRAMPDKQVGSRSVAMSSSGPDCRNGSTQQPAWSVSSRRTSATMTAPRRNLEPWRGVTTVLFKVACGPGIPRSRFHVTAPCSAAWVPAVVISPSAITHAQASLFCRLCCVPAGSIVRSMLAWPFITMAT